MSLFDWFKPLDKAIGVVDELVEDKDKANELKAELRHAEIDLRRMAETTYMAELKVETIPWVDALHKMGRQIGSFTSMILSGGVVIYMIHKNMPITLETMGALAAMNGPQGIYNYIKGKGKS